jgi:exopolyphosphatase/guanosine-5'-triphosphate,3'-diphosphate pyrophosphatase
MEATVAVVAQYVQEARSAGASAILCVATSAARDAINGHEFFAAISDRAGIAAEVIPGDEEARLSYLAAEADFGAGPKIVLDIGGGSTEVIYGSSGKISFSHSYDIGSVRLTERHVRSDPPTPSEREAVERDVAATLRGVPKPPGVARLIGIAGTVTTLFAVARRMAVYDAAQVHGQELSRAEIAQTRDRLWSMSLGDRTKLPGLQPKRADVIPAGASILVGAMDQLSVDAVRVSDHGVRWGLLAARFGARS